MNGELPIEIRSELDLLIGSGVEIYQRRSSGVICLRKDIEFPHSAVVRSVFGPGNECFDTIWATGDIADKYP